MERSFSLIDDDNEVFLPEDSPKENTIKTEPVKNDDNESDLSLSEKSSISPKRSEDLQKLKDLRLSSRSEEYEFDKSNSPSPKDSDNVSENSSVGQSALPHNMKLNEPLAQTSHFLSDSDGSEVENETYVPNNDEKYVTDFSPKNSNSPSTNSSHSNEQNNILNRGQLNEFPVPPLSLVDSDEIENEESSRIDDEKFVDNSILLSTDSGKTNDIISGRQTAVLRRRTLNEPKIANLLTDSDESDTEDKTKLPVPGEYNPKDYENLEVDDETRELFQLIFRYTPQQLTLTNKFKPFIPEFLPAVGDIDAFLKVYHPDTTINDEKCKESFDHLGLTVLDEPASNQSDPAVLYLQLRAASGNPRKKNDGNVLVKKIDNVEKNSKTIEKWIKDISDLHKSKSIVVRYSESMPDIDDLMAEWPETVENELKEKGFPKPENMSLQEYINTICNLFQIPVAKKKVHSLYLLFCLYGAIKQTQLYKNEKERSNAAPSPKKKADQLVLE